MKTLFLLGMMVVGAGAQTAKPVAKQENPRICGDPGLVDCTTYTLPGTSDLAGYVRVYNNADLSLLATCDATGDWPHEVVSNCVISEGHTLTEVMQAWVDSVRASDEQRDAERKDSQRHYQVLWQSYYDYLMQSKKDLQAIHHALRPAELPKGAKP